MTTYFLLINLYQRFFLSEHRNFIEAAFVGVSSAIPLVLNIGANLIAFLGLLAAVNGFLSWFGGLLDFPELSFEVRYNWKFSNLIYFANQLFFIQLMCSYIFLPVTYLMGIEWVDCFKVSLKLKFIFCFYVFCLS